MATFGDGRNTWLTGFTAAKIGCGDQRDSLALGIRFIEQREIAMVRVVSFALLVAGVAGLTILGLPAASVTLADDLAGGRGAADSGQFAVIQGSGTPRPTPRPSATPTPAASSPASTATACAHPTVSFNGAAYCPATIGAIRGTGTGTGSRVVLRGVTVTEVTTGTVTVAAWATPPCPPGKHCGQLLTLQSLTVAWSGTSRPAYGDVLDLFGWTIPTSISPVGYVKTGWCPIDWC